MTQNILLVLYGSTVRTARDDYVASSSVRLNIIHDTEFTYSIIDDKFRLYYFTTSMYGSDAEQYTDEATGQRETRNEL